MKNNVPQFRVDLHYYKNNSIYFEYLIENHIKMYEYFIEPHIPSLDEYLKEIQKHDIFEYFVGNHINEMGNFFLK